MRLTEVEIQRSAGTVRLVGRVERLSDARVPWAVSETHFAGKGSSNEIRFEFPRAWHYCPVKC